MNLHNEIMNIQERKGTYNDEYCYKLGHRDARHAAAELSLKAEARIEELEAEIDKLKRDVKDIEREYLNSDACWNAVLDYVLNKGYMESPLEFLRCWNEGNFEALREEWPDAPEEIYFADPLYKGNK